jgi:ribosomal-protein-alanine N-acetyltransferase
MNRPFSIRLLRFSDLDGILRIEHASFGKDAYDRNLFADLMHQCGELFLVAVNGRSVCGYMVTCTSGRTASAELVSTAVAPRHRGKGIASALMASTLRRLRRRGVARFHLTVKVTNRIAIRFYERYGFHKSRIARGYYEDGAHGWRMTRYLNSQSK